MSSVTSCLYRDLPAEQLLTLYPKTKTLPFKPGETIYTSFPKETALMRSLGIVALAIITFIKPAVFIAGASYVVLTSYVFPSNTDHYIPGAIALTVAVASNFLGISAGIGSLGSLATLVYAAWTAYSNIAMEDPLVSTSYQITGGQEQFNKLPELPKLESTKSLKDWMFNTDWNKLEAPVYRAQTLDGRHVMIVKTVKQGLLEKDPFLPNSLGIEVFVEKYSEQDNNPDIHWGSFLMDALFSTHNTTWASYSGTSSSVSVRKDITVINSKNLGIANQKYFQ